MNQRAKYNGRPEVQLLRKKAGAAIRRPLWDDQFLVQESVLALSDDFRSHLGGVEVAIDGIITFLGMADLWDGLAVVDFFDKVENLRSQEWVAFDGAIELTGLDGFEGALDAIDRDDRDILARLFAGFLDRLDGSQGHVVIVDEHGVDFGAVGAFEYGLGHFLAFVALEVARLADDDLHIR